MAKVVVLNRDKLFKVYIFADMNDTKNFKKLSFSGFRAF